MCAAIEEMKIDSEIKGIVETCNDFDISLQTTIQRIAEKFNLPLEESEKEVKKYWK